MGLQAAAARKSSYWWSVFPTWLNQSRGEETIKERKKFRKKERKIEIEDGTLPDSVLSGPSLLQEDIL